LTCFDIKDEPTIECIQKRKYVSISSSSNSGNCKEKETR
jgi:hypothetical protein